LGWEGTNWAKRLSNINVKANTSEFSLGTIKGDIINLNKLANILEQLFKRLLFPQFQWEPGYFNPLINSMDCSRIRVKERFPPAQH